MPFVWVCLEQNEEVDLDTILTADIKKTPKDVAP